MKAKVHFNIGFGQLSESPVSSNSEQSRLRPVADDDGFRERAPSRADRHCHRHIFFLLFNCFCFRTSFAAIFSFFSFSFLFRRFLMSSPLILLYMLRCIFLLHRARESERRRTANSSGPSRNYKTQARSQTSKSG